MSPLRRSSSLRFRPQASDLLVQVRQNGDHLAQGAHSSIPTASTKGGSTIQLPNPRAEGPRSEVVECVGRSADTAGNLVAPSREHAGYPRSPGQLRWRDDDGRGGRPVFEHSPRSGRSFPNRKTGIHLAPVGVVLLVKHSRKTRSARKPEGNPRAQRQQFRRTSAPWHP